MRLLVVGTPHGKVTAAAKIAMNKGAAIFLATSSTEAIAALWSGYAADLLVVEIGVDIRNMVLQLETEAVHLPIIACGTENNLRAAVSAILAGAKDYISLLPDAEIIALMLVAVADGTGDVIDGCDAAALMVEVAEHVKPSGALVRRTIAEVERDLILETLQGCLGNRTHAADFLGISVRTLRNKLHDYAANGVPVPAPGRGELRGAA